MSSKKKSGLEMGWFAKMKLGLPILYKMKLKKIIKSAIDKDYSKAANLAIVDALAALGCKPIEILVKQDPANPQSIYDLVIKKVLLTQKVVNELQKPSSGDVINRQGDDYVHLRELLYAFKINPKGNLLDTLFMEDLFNTKMSQELIDELDSAALKEGKNIFTSDNQIDRQAKTIKTVAIVFNFLNYIIPIKLEETDASGNTITVNTNIWSLFFEKIFYLSDNVSTTDIQLSLKDIEFILAVCVYIIIRDKNNPGIQESNPLNLLYKPQQNLPTVLKTLFETIGIGDAGLLTKITNNSSVYKYLGVLLGISNKQAFLEGKNKLGDNILDIQTINKLRSLPIRTFTEAFNFVYKAAQVDYDLDFIKLKYFDYILHPDTLISETGVIKLEQSGGAGGQPQPTTEIPFTFLSQVNRKDKVYLRESPYYQDTIHELILSNKYPLISQIIITLSISSTLTPKHREVIKKIKIPAPHFKYLMETLAPEMAPYFKKDVGMFRMVFYVLPYLLPDIKHTPQVYKLLRNLYNIYKEDVHKKLGGDIIKEVTKVLGKKVNNVLDMASKVMNMFDDKNKNDLNMANLVPLLDGLFTSLFYIVEQKNLITSHQSKLRKLILVSNVYTNVLGLAIKYFLYRDVTPDKRLDINKDKYDMARNLAKKIASLIYRGNPNDYNIILKAVYSMSNLHIGRSKDEIPIDSTVFTASEFRLIGKLYIYYTQWSFLENEKEINYEIKTDEIESTCKSLPVKACGKQLQVVKPLFGKPYTKIIGDDPASPCKWDSAVIPGICRPRITHKECSQHTSADTCKGHGKRFTKKSGGASEDICEWNENTGTCGVKNQVKMLQRLHTKDLAQNPEKNIVNFFKYLFTNSYHISHMLVEQALDYTTVDGVMYCDETSQLLNLISVSPYGVYMPLTNKRLIHVYLSESSNPEEPYVPVLSNVLPVKL